MHTVQFLSHIVENNQALAYLIIFLVTIVEGEVVAISAGILVLLGALNFWLCLAFVLLGGAVKTILGYNIGKILHKKYNESKYFQYLEKKILTIMPNFSEKPFWSIFISKFILLNHAVVMFAGYQQINFRTYLRAEFFSTIIWAPLMIGLGYFFSYTALTVSREVSKFSLIVILLILGLFAVDKIISWIYLVFQNLKNQN